MSKNISLFQFANDPTFYANGETFLANIAGESSDPHTFLDALGRTLQFPDYFGVNWNALDECIRDFTWTKKKRIVLFHPSLPSLEHDQLTIYLEILMDAVAYWQQDGDHDLVVVFPEAERDAIEGHLTNR